MATPMNCIKLSFLQMHEECGEIMFVRRCGEEVHNHGWQFLHLWTLYNPSLAAGV